MSTVLESQEQTIQAEPDFCDVYLANCLKTEAPLIFHRWSVLTAVGAALERNCYIKHGDNIIYPNMYTMLVGPSSSRKSSAVSGIAKLIRKAGFSKTYSGTTSKEKFLEDLSLGFDNINNGKGLMAQLEGGSGAETSAVLVTASEAVEFFGSNNSGMVNMMTDLWDNPDEKSIGSRKDGTATVKSPTVSLLAGTTSRQLSVMFPAEIIGQGILSRTLLIYCHGSGRKFTFPESTAPAEEAAQIKFLQHVIAKRGEFTFTEEAKKALDTIYHKWKPIKDGRFESYTGRRLDHLMKLCMLYCVVSLEINNNVIDITHVIKANTTLTYAECYMTDALGEFGGAMNSSLTTNIMSVVKAHKGGVTQSEVLGAVHTEYAMQKEVIASIIKLRDAGKIDIINSAGKNGVMERHIYPVNNILNTSLPFVDYNLLAEFTHERKQS